MLNFITTGKIVSLLLVWRYAIYFPLMVIEGPIVTIIAGFLTSLGYFSFALVYLVSVAGDLGGDILYYLIGRIGGGKILTREKFLGIKKEQWQGLENHFNRHSGKTLLFGKLTHSIGAPILVAAGLAKVPFRKFIWYNFIGTLPKSLAFLLIGFYFGQAYQQIDKYLGYAILSVFFAIILAAAIYLFAKRLRKNVEIDE